MRAVSLFSGAGGFEIGFDRAGISTVLQCEIDPIAQSVLRRHWPETERVSDVRDVAGVQPATGHQPSLSRRGDGASSNTQSQHRPEHRSLSVDLVYGGFPCQDLSVAGKRAGLGGERSGLWFEFHRVLRELRPRWAVIENVVGLLSSNQGRDFGVVLEGLEELGFGGISWAVLDAQNFGVPQRRRRVFIVAGPSRRACEQVLSLCESCGGNPEAGGTSGQDVAYALNASVRGTGDGHGNAWNSNYIANPLAGHHGHSSPRGDGSGTIADTIGTITANWHKGAGNTQVEMGIVQPTPAGVRRLTPLECERLMGWPEVAKSLTIEVCCEPLKNLVPAASRSPKSLERAGTVASAPSSDSASSADLHSPSSRPSTIELAEVHVAWSCEDGTIALTTNSGESLLNVSNAEASALFARLGLNVDSALLAAAMTSTLARTTPGGRVASQTHDEPSLALRSGESYVRLSGDEIAERVSDAACIIDQAIKVTRPTTLEVGPSSPTSDSILRTLCCFVVAAISGVTPGLIPSTNSFVLKLSLSSGWTRYDDTGRELADSHRYRLCGNGVASPVAEWIGRRLVAVDAMLGVAGAVA